MERLVTVKDVQERYSCSLPTARKYMRQIIPHMENPLTATETAFHEWEKSRMVYPGNKRKAELIRKANGVAIVPRTR